MVSAQRRICCPDDKTTNHNKSCNSKHLELLSMLQQCMLHVERDQFHPIVFDLLGALHDYASDKAEVFPYDDASLSNSPITSSQMALQRREDSVVKIKDDKIITTSHHAPSYSVNYNCNEEDKKVDNEPINNSTFNVISDQKNKIEATSVTPSNISKSSPTTTSFLLDLAIKHYNTNPSDNHFKLAATLRDVATDVENNYFHPNLYGSLSQIHIYAKEKTKWNSFTLLISHNDWVLTTILSHLPGHYIYIAPVCKQFEKTYLETFNNNTQTLMSTGVASIPCLTWARNHGYPWNKRTCSWAARCGNLDVLTWAHQEMNCPWSKWTCSRAAYGGHLEVLRWAHENGCPWDEDTCEGAARNGFLEVLKWARGRDCPWDKWTCLAATAGGHLEVLRWAREEGCPWDRNTCLTFANRKTRFWMEYGIHLKDE